MSSHREAPEISKDPVADSTDVYAFVSPDKPNTVTLIANYIPLQGPAGGPNFYEFGDDVLYEIHVDNTGNGRADISYRFRFTTEVLDPDTFLYNTGPIEALDSQTWNRRQTYDVTLSSGSSSQTIGQGLACPPCNIGPLSTPDYPALAGQAVHNLGGGITVFAGQRAEGFYVDLGAIFDLGNLRPFENLHAQYGLNVFSGPAPGVNATNHLNVHSISIQVPISSLTKSGHPTIGVWTTASRQRVRLWDADNGEEIEISRDDEPGDLGPRRTHSQVRPRHMPGQTRYAAVYPGLPAGRYTIWRAEHSPAAAVTVTGGQVSNYRWPG